MEENPYQPPRDLSPPATPPAASINWSKWLRTLGIYCGLISSAAFFSLLRYIWSAKNSALVNDPTFRNVGLGAVAIIFLAGIVALIAIVAGNVGGPNHQPKITPSSPLNTPGNPNIPYGGWIIAAIVLVVLSLLGWLMTRDPLAIRPG